MAVDREGPGRPEDKMERMRSLRRLTGLNRRSFCERYRIPYQTVTEWELGRREMPDYVLELLEYRVKTEQILKDLDLEEDFFD